MEVLPVEVAAQPSIATKSPSAGHRTESVKDLYQVGEMPPIGHVPKQMYAWLIRQERFGEPNKAFQVEVIDVPEPADDEVLVYVMAAGVNYNNVWAALGVPIDVIGARLKAGEKEPFHIGGSDGSGIVYKVGKDVTNVKVGDEVVIHCGSWDRNDPLVKAGGDPMYGASFRIWGYETNWGSFAQFTKVQAHQCLPKPKHLTWEAAAAYMLVGATAYRMLHAWPPHNVQPNDVVLIWGGAGGLGSQAIQIVKAAGGIPIAVISDESKVEFCMSLGAKGCINRKDFNHWGMLPHWKDTVGYNTWLKGVRSFGKAIWDVLGDRRSPRIVFEHPGETTVPTSVFVCDTGGMVVICAGTTGYNATVDLRYLWMRQKRLQGSHFANDDQAKGINDLVIAGKVDPCLSQTFSWDELPLSHQLMYENRHPHGNMSILVGAISTGLLNTADQRAAMRGLYEITSEAPAEAVEVEMEPEDIYARPRPGIPVGGEFVDQRPVQAVMHPGVITCSEATTVDEVARTMVENHIHAVVVVDEQGYASGVVSQTDMVLARQGRSPADVAHMTAADIMTPDLITCTLDTPVSDVITTLTRNRIHRLVVVQEEGEHLRPVGVISMTDIIRQMMGYANPAAPRDPA